jgi:hypothetical protein
MEGDVEHTAAGVRARGERRSSFAEASAVAKASEDREAGGEAAGEFDTAIGDAEEQELLSRGVAGRNGGGQAVESGMDLAGAEGLGFCHETQLWRKSVET